MTHITSSYVCGRGELSWHASLVYMKNIWQLKVHYVRDITSVETGIKHKTKQARPSSLCFHNCN